ncbi:MAG: hypothetical protein K2O03_04645, partial [Lachnospiraceae bacterium]|nr:hypothetical protein [Lachnospiraceae bacterium]
EFGRDMIVDANFDGWADFGYLKSIHDGGEYWEFWYWNEQESQFEEKWLGFNYFINPVFSADTKIVSCLDEESGSGNFYQWQNDSIYNVRSITTTYEEDEAYLSVTDYFGDIPVEIFGRSCEKDSGEWREQWELWCDLNYHGEPGSASDLLQNGIPEGTISAFVIRAGSEAKEMFVTAQPCGADDVMDTTGAQCWYDNGAIKFSVWNPNDMGKPIQTMCKYVEQYHYQGAFSGQYQMVDANFDGYMDFSWICHSGNQPIFYYLWLWDEEQGKFVEEPAYNEISSPVVDAKKKIISGWSRSSAATDGTSTFHKWIDGELLCVRHIFVWREIDAKNYIMTVEDRIGGEMVEVYREEFELDWDFIAEREKWLDLDYRGEK